MAGLLIVVDRKSDWRAFYPSEDLITVQEYLTRSGGYRSTRNLVINLSRSYRYLSTGYYCSLLAEARGHRVIPSVRTINDLSSRAIYALRTRDLNETLQRLTRARTGAAGEEFTVKIFFGLVDDEPLQDLARQIFELFPSPILEVRFRHAGDWSIDTIRPGAMQTLSETEEDRFAAALDRFSRKIWRKPRLRRRYRYDMAILVDPEEQLPPSNRGAVRRLVRAGRRLGIDVDLILRRDYGRIGEYDGLFIRETTAIDGHTYRFAKKAENEGMVVIDDPDSILKCTNKIYLADLLHSNGVATPATTILYKDDPAELEAFAARCEYPIVLKIPDGSFSRGISKAEDAPALLTKVRELFKESALLLAQEFLYTDYDWRIGILNQRPLFACRYFMSRGHWQIYKHSDGGKVQSGDFETLPVQQAPPKVIKTALKAANLIGDSLYGVDVKQSGERVVVIEVNDNPNIDHGVEDKFLGDDLYHTVMEEFLRRMERKRLGIS